MLMATLFTISRFNNYSEMTAINASGISIYRFSFPIFIFGLLITIAFYLLQRMDNSKVKFRKI